MRTTTGVLVLLLLAAATAPAATAIRATIEQLSKTAILVVRTRCVSVEARFTPDRSTIETHVKLEILESLVGTAPGNLTVLCRGGVVGDKALRVKGQAKFLKDEEDVVFLRKDRRGAWRVLGWCQGKFRIVRNEETGTVEAVQDLEGLCFVKGNDEDEPVSTKALRLALSSLTARIAAARTPPDDDGEADGDGATTDGEVEEKPPADESGQEAGDRKK